MGYSLKPDQVADAFVAVPGVRIDVINATNGTDTTTSGSFVACDAPNTVVDFIAPVAAKYRFFLSVAPYMQTAIGVIRFRAVIDAQVTDDDDRFDVQFSALFGERKYPTFPFEMDLTAGSHTFALQWKRVSGTGTCSVSNGGTVFCDAVAVTGSGAGGVIFDEDELVTYDVVDDVYTDIPNQSVAVTVPSNGEKLVVHVTGAMRSTTGSPMTGDIRLYDSVDGQLGQVQYATSASTADYVPFCLSRVTPTLSGGAHTITLQGKRLSSNTWRVVWANMFVEQYRGGLVEIRNNGVNKTNTPRALDFGPATNVIVDDTGVAHIDPMGAEGKSVDEFLFNDGTSHTITAGTWTAVKDNSGAGSAVEVGPITVAEGERVRLSGNLGWALTVAGSQNSWWGIGVNGADPVDPFHWVLVTDLSGITFNESFCFETGELTAGDYTFALMAKKGTATNIIIKGVSTAITLLQAVRTRGGYVQPENVPVFERDAVDTSAVNAIAGPNASSELRVRLNDGFLHKATAPLACDIDATGIGGRDATESVAVGLWNLFAVADGTNDFGLVLSQDTPANGPPSHPVFQYLWTVRVSATGATVIETFVQAGSWYYQETWATATYGLLNDDLTPGYNINWTSLKTELQAGIPTAIADMVDVNVLIDADPSDAWYFYVAPGDPATVTVSTLFSIIGQQTAGTGEDKANNRFIIALKDEAISYNLRWTSGNINLRMGLVAYRNALYPGGDRGAQAVAQDNFIGEMYISASGATTTAQTPTYTKIAGTYSDGELRGFTHATGTLTYTGARTKKFRVQATISCHASVADDYYVRLSKGGAEIAATEQQRAIGGATDIGMMFAQGVVELATSDTITVEVTRKSVPAANFTAEKMVVIVTPT